MVGIIRIKKASVSFLIAGLVVLLLSACTPSSASLIDTCPTSESIQLEDEAGYLSSTVTNDELTVEPAQTTTQDIPVSLSPPTQVDQANVAVANSTELTGEPSADIVDDSEASVITVPDGLPPVIVSHTPGNKAGVVWTQDIRILFSRPMNPTTTERAITVTPDDRDFEINWSRDGKLIQLVPAEEWVAFEWYVVTVGAEAATVGGTPLGTAYSFSFWGEEP